MLYSLLLKQISTSILPLMALDSLYCADVPLCNYSLTQPFVDWLRFRRQCSRQWSSVVRIHYSSVRCPACVVVYATQNYRCVSSMSRATAMSSTNKAFQTCLFD